MIVELTFFHARKNHYMEFVCYEFVSKVDYLKIGGMYNHAIEFILLSLDAADTFGGFRIREREN